MFRKIGNKWKDFVDQLKQTADTEDESQILIDDFKNVCTEYSFPLNNKDRQYLIEAFPGKESGSDDVVYLNIARIFDQKYNIILEKMYN